MQPRHAVLVGGTGGLGRALAARLLDDGWRVTLVSRSTRAPALEARGARWERLDVQEDPARLAALKPDALALLNGGFHRVALPEESAEGFRAAFDQDLHPVFEGLQAVLPGMAERGWGRVVTTPLAGSDSLQGAPWVAARRAAGTALISLTRSFAKQYASSGVTVNALALGYIETGSDQAPQHRPSIPMQRTGTAVEAASAAHYLFGDEAGYVTGAVLHVSGGWGV